MIARTTLMLGFLLLGGVISSKSSSETDSDKTGDKREKAIFAGGCFWCMEPAFDSVPGVISTQVGYIGGRTANPTYDQVCSGMTGHAEAMELVYDPAKISFKQLLDIFWHNIDPTVKDQQFCDEGTQYRTAIFFIGKEQEREAKESKAALDKTKPFREPIVTEIVAATTFYPAEDYHQQYCKTHKLAYGMYRINCGRDHRLRQLWGAAAPSNH
jgi:peptide-methionine (S)-S-oxide reductase